MVLDALNTVNGRSLRNGGAAVNCCTVSGSPRAIAHNCIHGRELYRTAALLRAASVVCRYSPNGSISRIAPKCASTPAVHAVAESSERAAPVVRA